MSDEAGKYEPTRTDAEKRNLTCLVGVRLLPPEYERGLELAKREGTTLASLMRRLLQEHLAEVALS